MYINYFHYVLRDDCDITAYRELSEAMYGFVSVERFGTDREGIVLERFLTLEGAARWAKCAEHRAAMRRGRSEFYERYEGAGTLIDHEYSFDRSSLRGADSFQ